ncbi:hypothetical protein [Sphingomonas sp. TWP1-3-1]|uniref:hypothetical protein n=1 Tax=Sphingomonas sp. TWP1-3-1 TaxID=2804612 RepID=UPI003CF1B2D6
MSRLDLIEALGASLDDSVVRQDWAEAQRSVEQIIAAVARSVASGDGSQAEALVDVAAGAAARMGLEAGVSARPSATSVVWLLKAAAAFAQIGRQGLARPEDGHTRDLIVDRLRKAALNGATNSELAIACGRSVETISRVLRTLRREGVVEYQSIGRSRRNWLAEIRARAPVEVPAAAPVAVVHNRDEVVTHAAEMFEGQRHEPLPEATPARELA